jgi:hypothetical protein
MITNVKWPFELRVGGAHRCYEVAFVRVLEQVRYHLGVGLEVKVCPFAMSSSRSSR